MIEKSGERKQAAEAESFMRSLFEIAKGKGSDTAQVGRLIDTARKRPWFALTVAAPFADTTPKELLPLLRRAWTRELGADVSGPLHRVRSNVLAIQGTADRDVPSGATARALRHDMRGMIRSKTSHCMAPTTTSSSGRKTAALMTTDTPLRYSKI